MSKLTAELRGAFLCLRQARREMQHLGRPEADIAEMTALEIRVGAHLANEEAKEPKP